MSGTQPESRRVSPARARALRDEFGPCPWWDADRLHELVEERGLSAAAVAEVFGAHPETVRSWIGRYRKTEWSA